MSRDLSRLPEYSMASDKSSYAYFAVTKLWPVIITRAIDRLHRDIVEHDKNSEGIWEGIPEGKEILKKLSELKYQLQHNHALTPLKDDGGPGIDKLNAIITAPDQPKWLNSPFTFLETYLDRRIHALFTPTKCWNSFDPFHDREKIQMTDNARLHIAEVAKVYNKAVQQFTANSESASVQTPKGVQANEESTFRELCKLSAGEISRESPPEGLQQARPQFIIDQSEFAYISLKRARSQGKDPRTVHIICNDAGPELFSDICLAAYLVVSGLATQAILHLRCYLGFSANAVHADISNILEYPAFHENGEDPDIKFAIMHLHELGNKWTVDVPNPFSFWTLHYDFWQIPRETPKDSESVANQPLDPHQSPELYQKLQKAELVIFKGDFHYRKLIGNRAWPPTTSFAEAIGPFGKGSGIRTLALQTCRSDAIVGLEEDQDQALRATEGGGGDSGQRKWAWEGKYGVMQFCDGKI